ncbi:MAG: coenzyme F420-0:L-glutamate ligase [Caldilineaceae bacterium]|nr:coenzyme F420-0:L-glutamate ligase [Caldilineaceae bacterium]
MCAMTLFAVENFPLVHSGDNLAALVVDRLTRMGEQLEPGDILVIAQKIVSKAEGRVVDLATVTPTSAAQELAALTGKDSPTVQVILDDSNEVIRALPGLLITEQRSGWICAHAGVDRSNVDGGSALALLPADADASAAQIREEIAALTGVAPGVLINDSHGRPWRQGTVGVCIGCAGLPPVWNQRGLHDLYGYELTGSEECIADELTGAASLIMGQSDEARPVVVIRGYPLPPVEPAPAKSIQRPKERDAFR